MIITATENEFKAFAESLEVTLNDLDKAEARVSGLEFERDMLKETIDAIAQNRDKIRSERDEAKRQLAEARAERDAWIENYKKVTTKPKAPTMAESPPKEEIRFEWTPFFPLPKLGSIF